MTGGLYDPLGTDRPDPSRGGSRPTAPFVVAGLMLAALAVLLAVAYVRDDGDRGQPVAVAPIEHVLPPPGPLTGPAGSAPQAAATSQTPAAEAGLPPVRADQEVEIQNGVRIVRPRRAEPAGTSRSIEVPGPQTPR